MLYINLFLWYCTRVIMPPSIYHCEVMYGKVLLRKYSANACVFCFGEWTSDHLNLCAMLESSTQAHHYYRSSVLYNPVEKPCFFLLNSNNYITNIFNCIAHTIHITAIIWNFPHFFCNQFCASNLINRKLYNLL